MVTVDVEPHVKNTGIPLQYFSQGVPGPDGRWWVSAQIQQGQIALSFAMPAETVEEFLRKFGQELRTRAAQVRAQNGGTTVAKSGLLIAGPGNVVPRRPHP